MSDGAESGGQRRLLFATSNPGKLSEGRSLLSDLPLELLSLADLDLGGEVIEDAPDFEGNARLKARHWVQIAGLPVLADDSGIEVDALDGEPGVRSARFGGSSLDDAGRNALLLQRLAGVPAGRRGARFVCVLVLVGLDGRDLAVARGESVGAVASSSRGGHGFGYDPVFEPSGWGGRTFAELNAADKHAASHRGAAFRELRTLLKTRAVPI